MILAPGLCFALVNARIMAFCDEIFDMFVATVAKILDSRIVYSFAVKHVPNLRKIMSWILVSLEIDYDFIGTDKLCN